MKFYATIVFLVFLLVNTKAQKVEEITHREINIQFNDSSIKANVLLADKKIKLNNQIDYYWYQNNAIKINQGGFKGKLLDGDYQVTIPKGNLIKKGNFKNGNVSGEWKI